MTNPKPQPAQTECSQIGNAGKHSDSFYEEGGICKWCAMVNKPAQTALTPEQIAADAAWNIGTGGRPLENIEATVVEAINLALTQERAARERENRWEVGIRNIVTRLHGPRYEFEIGDIVNEVSDMAARLKQVEAELREHEWGKYFSTDKAGTGPCPICRQVKLYGHKEDCWLAKLLPTPPEGSKGE